MTADIRPSPAPTPWLLLAGIWALVTLANLWKPFQVDDTAHLEIARWIMAHPTRPMSGPLNWVGLVEPIHRTNQPHLFFYLMAGWGRVFGWGEIAMHTLIAVAAGACILFLYRIARRLIPDHALWITAVVVLSPAFVVSQNVMVDVPLLALWLWFFDALLRPDPAGNQTRRYLTAAIACTAALLTKYSSLPLVPVLGASLLVERRWRQAWVILIPVVGIAAWSAFNIWDYGGVHIAQRNGGSGDLLRPFKFAIAWVLILGGVSPIGLAFATRWPVAARRAAWLFAGAGAALVLLAALVALGIVSDSASDRALWVAFALNGALIVGALARPFSEVARAAWSGAEVLRAQAYRVVLALWIAGAGTFYLLFPAFSAVRHVLTVLPAIVLFACIGHPAMLTRQVKAAALLSLVPLTAALAAADYRFADFYRREAPRIVAALSPALPPGSTIWTSGHWGWQWYAAQAGMKQIDYRRSAPRAGDVYVEAIDVDHQYPTAQLALAPLGVIEQGATLNPFCTARPDRFYRSGSRYGAWSLSRACGQRLLIYRVLRDHPAGVPSETP